MVDFQNKNLSRQFYELMAKLPNYGEKGKQVKFVPSQYSDGKWKCALAQDIVDFPIEGFGETEEAAINMCAGVMLSLLNKKEKKQNSKSEDNQYYCVLTEIFINPNDQLLIDALKKYCAGTIRHLENNGEEVVKVLNGVTVRLLVKNNNSLLF